MLYAIADPSQAIGAAMVWSSLSRSALFKPSLFKRLRQHRTDTVDPRSRHSKMNFFWKWCITSID
jgi:hypothetical protein